MKFLITLLTMLAMQTICSAGDQDKHKDMMIVLHGGHDLVLIHISTKELIVFERGRKTKKRIRKTTELNELESKKIWALLENVNRKEWEGLWINYNILGGYGAEVELNLGEDTLQFVGSNVFPKDFIRLMKLIESNSDHRLIKEFPKNSEFDPKNDKHFKDYEGNIETIYLQKEKKQYQP